MQTLAQNFGLANYDPPALVADAAYSAQTQWLSLKGYSKVTFIVQCGSMGEASATIKVHQAKGVSGSSASATALGLSHYWSNKAGATTAILTRTAGTSSAVVVDSTNNATYVFEVDAKQLNATSSYDCVGLAYAGISTSDMVGVLAILHDPRYAADPMYVDANV